MSRRGRQRGGGREGTWGVGEEERKELETREEGGGGRRRQARCSTGMAVENSLHNRPPQQQQVEGRPVVCVRGEDGESGRTGFNSPSPSRLSTWPI